MPDPKQSPVTDGGEPPDAARPGSRRERSGPIPLRGGEPVTLLTTDGALLRGELLLPAGDPPRVVAALSHAMMVDRRTLDVSGRAAGRLAAPRGQAGAGPPNPPPPASWGQSGPGAPEPPPSAPQPASGGPPSETGGILTELLRAGVAVLWFDQRGHGQSGPTPAQGGRWDYDDLVADAGVVAEYLRTRLPGARRVAIGHSLFGHVALAYQAQTAQRIQAPALYPPEARADATLASGGSPAAGPARARPGEGRAGAGGSRVSGEAGAPGGSSRERQPALDDGLVRRAGAGGSRVSGGAGAQGGSSRERRPALYDGLVLIGGNVWLRQLEPSWSRLVRKRLSYETLLLLCRPLGYLPVRRLRIGTADEPAAYLEQMGQWLRRGDWTDRSGRSYLAALPHVREPILSIAGAGDRLMAVPSCQLALVRRTSGPVSHWLIGRAQGDALDPGHMELVLDPRLRPRWRALARWVAALGDAPSPAE